jgi:metallo-beta-lactamase family protein
MTQGIRFYADIIQPPTEVTGSFTTVVVKANDRTIKFAVDCGLYQEREYEKQNYDFPTNPEELDFAILTHNHVDHNGRFPFLVHRGFKGPIYTTNVTKALLGRALGDNLKVMSDTSKRRNNGPLYDENDIDQTLKITEGCEYLKPVNVNENVELHFLYNGHLPGAACVLVHLKCDGFDKDIYILFSGDYNDNNMFFPVPPFRDWIHELPNLTVVIESTYGTMDLTDIHYCFEENILHAVQNGYTIVVPAFSLGRGQEILAVLKSMQEKYPNPMKQVPIYYDGKLAFYYTDMYKYLYEQEMINFYLDKVDFVPGNCIRVTDRQMRRDIIADTKRKIIVTSSGMGSYGPAQTYIPHIMQREKSLIHFTGYCAEGTLGYRLKEAQIGEIVEVAGLQIEKKGNVEFTNEFSAHAKGDQLLGFLKQFRNLNTVLINHGSYENKHEFAKRIIRQYDEDNVPIVGILGEDYFYRINSDGFDKTMTTKW